MGVFVFLFVKSSDLNWKKRPNRSQRQLNFMRSDMSYVWCYQWWNLHPGRCTLPVSGVPGSAELFWWVEYRLKGEEVKRSGVRSRNAWRREGKICRLWGERRYVLQVDIVSEIKNFVWGGEDEKKQICNWFISRYCIMFCILFYRFNGLCCRY